MSNFSAYVLITLGVALTVAAGIAGQVDLGELALLSFALLIARNCQDWTKGKK